ncbi:hypothetical protein H257_09447 [Aphanomyces astaci]|uniref:Adenosylcobinamide-GDP ribazoletransferase n=1 Tax=Aphanomyces astaci TaxID=112090 RepID=W4GBS9_APHAT|nr:hypothetical protein H257_09447 [Aphanomyces astaci]ETV76418.1 hypothetical protein H257_09447 [Aphanomyces astaci]RQM12013.1 hypothetical protein B5M09_010242 [Aphanomyces astaci]|eukprot:XP_009833963.1 hypothetical protein H257_09447 [Aphanomyces astaci]
MIDSSRTVTKTLNDMAGFEASELRQAAASRFGGIGILEDIGLQLCALQETPEVRVDNPVVVVFSDDQDNATNAVRVVAAASQVSYHAVQVVKTDALDMEQCLHAMHQGRDAIKKTLLDNHHAMVIVGLPASPDFAATAASLLSTKSGQDPMTLLVATHSPVVAAICGAVVEAAAHKIPVVLDGLAAIVAGVMAAQLAPHATRHVLFAANSQPPHESQLQDTVGFSSQLRRPSITHIAVPHLPCGVGGLHVLALLRTASLLMSSLSLPKHPPTKPIDPPPATAPSTPSGPSSVVDGLLPPPPELRIFLTSVMFLTRLPAYMIIPDLDHNVRELVPSFCYFPCIGWAVGAFAAVWLVGGLVLFGSTPVAVILSTFASVWLTGCFHEDGVADTFDSFGGGWSKDDILRIMKDSRLGTYGCMGLLLMTALKLAVLAHLVDTTTTTTTVVDPPLFSIVSGTLVAGHVLGRYSSLFILQFYPYIEDERDPKGPLYNGIGNNLHLLTSWRVCTATVFTALSMVSLLGTSLGLCAFSVGLLVSFLAGQYFSGVLGGVIGDCLGCANQVVEVAVYLTVVAVLHISTSNWGLNGL